MKKFYSIFSIYCLLLFISCENPNIYKGSIPEGIPKKLLFFNGLDETLSIIDPENYKIYNNVATTEQAPNHILSRKERVFITNSLSNSIQVFTYKNDKITQTGRIYLGKDLNPWMIISDGGSRGYIPCFVTGDIAIIDLDKLTVIDAYPQTEEVIDRIPTGECPEGGSIINSKLYIANTAWSQDIFGFKKGSVTIIDTSTNKVVKTLMIDDLSYVEGKGSNPQSIIPFPDKKEAHVVCTGIQGENDGKIAIIDTDKDIIKKILYIGGSPGWAGGAINHSDKTVYLTGVSGIQAYNYDTGDFFGKNYSGLGWYIWKGEKSIMDFYSGIYYDRFLDSLFICRFNKNTIMVIKKMGNGEYKEITQMETFNGPQGNIIELPD